MPESTRGSALCCLGPLRCANQSKKGFARSGASVGAVSCGALQGSHALVKGRAHAPGCSNTTRFYTCARQPTLDCNRSVQSTKPQARWLEFSPTSVTCNLPASRWRLKDDPASVQRHPLQCPPTILCANQVQRCPNWHAGPHGVFRFIATKVLKKRGVRGELELFHTARCRAVARPSRVACSMLWTSPPPLAPILKHDDRLPTDVALCDGGVQ